MILNIDETVHGFFSVFVSNEICAEKQLIIH